MVLKLRMVSLCGAISAVGAKNENDETTSSKQGCGTRSKLGQENTVQTRTRNDVQTRTRNDVQTRTKTKSNGTRKQS